MKKNLENLYKNFPFLFLAFCCIATFIKNEKIRLFFLSPALFFCLIYRVIGFIQMRKERKEREAELEEFSVNDAV